MTVNLRESRPLRGRPLVRATASLVAGMATGAAVAEVVAGGALAGPVAGALDTALGGGTGVLVLGLLGRLTTMQEALLLALAVVGAMVPALVMKAVGMTAADILRDRRAAGEQGR